MTAVSAMVAVSGRHRYRCAACGWTGWKHRLRRRTNAAVGLAEKTTPSASAVAFFVLVLGLLLVVLVLLGRSCAGTMG